MQILNETHDPALRSWVASANQAQTDFPIQNLPFAVFRRQRSTEAYRGGVAIGDQILDLAAVAARGVLSGAAAAAVQAASGDSLNALMALGQPAWSSLRLALSRALRDGATEQAKLTACLVAQAAAEYSLPARIGDYTDFYTSIHHATNIGRQFRPDNPLLPNFKWIPIGYHGRASSIGVSGQRFPRPVGQTMVPGASAPSFGPCKRLDYELEMGIFVGSGNALGQPIAITEAEASVFGMCLLNDWSARDIQPWEYQPLGPFLAKNFMSTVSPWVITPEALAPFRIAQTPRAAGDPHPLAYLWNESDQARGAYDVALEVLLSSEAMRRQGIEPQRISASNVRHLYWTTAQLVAHHASKGCNLQPGDLLGTGTISGPTRDSLGSLLEITEGGRKPLTLPTTEKRTFLEDGDEVILRARAAREGFVSIGFGDCRGLVVP